LKLVFRIQRHRSFGGDTDEIRIMLSVRIRFVFLGFNTCNLILYAKFACFVKKFPNIVPLTAACLYSLNLGIIVVILMIVFWHNPDWFGVLVDCCSRHHPLY